MKDGLLFVLIGGLLGYGGSLLQHYFAVNRQKKDEIWKEKIRIYTNVLKELGSSFLEIENFPNHMADPFNHTKFCLRLGSILAPARLIASNKLEAKLRDLYEEEVLLYESTYKNRDEKTHKSQCDIAMRLRYEVEQEMRNELKT